MYCTLYSMYMDTYVLYSVLYKEIVHMYLGSVRIQCLSTMNNFLILKNSVLFEVIESYVQNKRRYALVKGAEN